MKQQTRTVQNDISTPTKEFISRHIVSVQQLETLLLLHENKDRDWSPAEINDRLRSQETSVSQSLGTLVSLSLVSLSNGRYRFAPASDQLDRETSALANAYRERPIRVIELIFSQPKEDLLNFVRAFELRKKP